MLILGALPNELMQLIDEGFRRYFCHVRMWIEGDLIDFMTEKMIGGLITVFTCQISGSIAVLAVILNHNLINVFPA